MLLWGICAVVGIVLTIVYVTNAPSFHIPILAVLIGFHLLIALGPMRDRNALQKKFAYAITNKRVILFKESMEKYYSMALSEIGEAKLVEQKGGHGHIIMGPSAAKTPEKKIRSIALIPETNPAENDRLTGLVFYNVPDAKKAKDLIQNLKATPTSQE